MVANRLRDAAAVLEVDSAYRRDAAIMREAADEVERLRHDIARHVAITCELATECERLRAELATEHKRQSAMRALIASLEGQLMRYRSKQAEADEAVRTLDSERAANATLTAELAECSAVIEAARCIRHWHDAPNEGMVVSGSHVRELWKALNNYDAARKGEGEYDMDLIAEDIGDAGADARIEARTVAVLGSKRYEEKAGWTCAGCAFLVPVGGCSKTPEQRTALNAAFSGSCPERGVVYVEVKDA